uniref:Uncharacterized protein n=1 Tax=Glycine max TaxID=3847 RepID=A0A0R0HDS7_SOYBN
MGILSTSRAIIDNVGNLFSLDLQYRSTSNSTMSSSSIIESKRLAITYGALAVRRHYRQCRHLSWSQVSSSLFVVLFDVPSLPFPHRRRHRHAPNPSLLSYNMVVQVLTRNIDCMVFSLMTIQRS